MRIKQLKAKRAETVKALDELLAAPQKEGRALTADERTKAKALQAEIDGLDEDIAIEEKRLEAAARRGADAPEGEAGGKADVAATTAVRVAADADPKRGFKTPRDFLTAVIDAGRNPRRADKRLIPLSFRARFPEQEATAGSDEHGEYSDPYGGFLIPEGLAPGVRTLPAPVDPTAGLVTPIPMSAPIVNINARVDKNHSTSVSGGLRVYRRSETQESSSSRMQFEQVKLEAMWLDGVAYATEELLTDSPVSFAALIAAGFNDEFVAKKLDEKLNGTGVAEYEGALNAACKISVSKETGQAAATINHTNILKMIARAWNYGSAVWMAIPSAFPQVRTLAQVIGTMGYPVYVPGNAQGIPASLEGRPIFFTEFCQALGTEGDIVLVSWSEFLEGTLGGRDSAESMHVRFLARERTFRVGERNAGKWWWRSALTPRRGDTLSPVVTLATRA